jgi:hypothetical protein
MTAALMLWDFLTTLAPPWESLGVVALAWAVCVVAVLSGYDPSYDGDDAEDD